jgi:thioredoxin-dependent peroxiredoxin
MSAEEGKKAPSFALPGDDGKKHKLSDHAGKLVVLYFYPRDDTPGCTVEACEFRDDRGRLEKLGAVVYGASRDSLSSHEKFRDKYELNFPLLSDPDLEVHKKYGAWGTKKLYGKETEGVIRSTFLVDGSGKVAKAWRNVKAKGHASQVAEAIAALKKG